MNLSEFHQKISNAGKPVVVDFWAAWCVPCRITKPILEKLAHEYNDRVLFLPVDADESREVLEHFRVIGIPTVMTLRNGDVVGRVTGAACRVTRPSSRGAAIGARGASADRPRRPCISRGSLRRQAAFLRIAE